MPGWEGVSHTLHDVSSLPPAASLSHSHYRRLCLCHGLRHWLRWATPSLSAQAVPSLAIGSRYAIASAAEHSAQLSSPQLSRPQVQQHTDSHATLSFSQADCHRLRHRVAAITVAFSAATRSAVSLAASLSSPLLSLSFGVKCQYSDNSSVFNGVAGGCIAHLLATATAAVAAFTIGPATNTSAAAAISVAICIHRHRPTIAVRYGLQ